MENKEVKTSPEDKVIAETLENGMEVIYVDKEVPAKEEKPEKTGKKQAKVDGRKKTQFKKGQSGNPAGKPKGTLSLTSMIKRKLLQMSPDGKRDALEVLAENIIQDALDNNNKMRQLIWNYVDGMPRQGMDIKHEIKQILTQEQINELFKRRDKK